MAAWVWKTKFEQATSSAKSGNVKRRVAIVKEPMRD